MGVCTFLLAGYHQWVAQKSMFKRLYGEERDDDLKSGSDDTSDQLLNQADDDDASQTPKEILRTKIEKRKDFSASYCSFMLMYCFVTLCCCFKKCCGSSGRWRRHLDNLEKFRIAQDRLNQEQDIQYLIEMNRVTRLLHRMWFMQRHRRILAFSHKYVITADDIARFNNN